MPPDEADTMKETEMNKLDQDEEDVARLLQAAGARAELPEALKQRWEEQFRRELKPAQHKRKLYRRATMSLCAGIAALGLATLLALQAPEQASLAMSVASVSGDSWLLARDNNSALRAGQQLAENAVVETETKGFVAIRYGEYDLRINGNSRVQLTDEGIALEAGEIYLSNQGRNTPEERITVTTPFGTVEDIGTQFTVKLGTDHAISSVRRGTIVVTTPSDQYVAEAGVDNAREITFDGVQRVKLADRAPSGPDWNWIYHSAPQFQLEGQSVYEFLQWSSHESGMRLNYASESAEIYARTTILHGDINGLDPDRAVEPVLATTHLTVERDESSSLTISLPARL